MKTDKESKMLQQMTHTKKHIRGRGGSVVERRTPEREVQGTTPKSNRKAMNRNWSNQNANPALKTKAGNK